MLTYDAMSKMNSDPIFECPDCGKDIGDPAEPHKIDCPSTPDDTLTGTADDQLPGTSAQWRKALRPNQEATERHGQFYHVTQNEKELCPICSVSGHTVFAIGVEKRMSNQRMLQANALEAASVIGALSDAKSLRTAIKSGGYELRLYALSKTEAMECETSVKDYITAGTIVDNVISHFERRLTELGIAID